MLQQLFDAWHPNGVETDLQVSTEVPSDSTNSTITFGPTPSLNKTRAPDNSAIVGLPEGWGVDIRSGKGSLIVHGSGGEEIGFNLTRTAVDTSNTTEQENLRLGTAANIPNVVYSAFNTNVARNFTSLMQAWRKADNLPPAQMHIDSAEEMKASSGEHCARAKGQMDPDGKGMKAMNIMLCVSESGQPGIYTITKHYSLVPIDKANSDQNAVFAIVSSIKLNQDALEEQAEDAGNAAANRPQNETERIQLLGNQAVTRYNLTQALSDAQHPAYWAQQQNSTTASVHPTSKFSNFLLDLACLEDGRDNTIVNTTAEALAKADPDRFEIVNEPNYWQGVEY
jgi:hypothetical protein